MKLFTYIILYLFIPGFVLAINVEKSPELIADSIFISATEAINNGEFQQAQILLNNSLDIYQELDDNKKIAETLQKLGAAYYYGENYSSALSVFEQSNSYYKLVDDLEGVSKTYNSMGAIYYYIGNNLLALEYYKKASKIQSKLIDDELSASINQNIGALYLELEDYNNALIYLNKSKESNQEKKNQDLLALNLNTIGEVYSQKKEFEKALNHFKKSLSIADNIKNVQRRLEVIFNLGMLYTNRHKTKEALTYYQEAFNLSKALNNKRYKSNSLIYIGNSLRSLKKIDSSISHCLLGYSLADTLQSIDIKQSACECLYKGYKAQGNNKKALFYYELSTAFNDSLNIDETSNQILNMEFEKQTLLDSIAHVTQQNEIEVAHLKRMNEQKNQRNMILASTGLIVLFAGSLWNRLSFVKKTKATLQIEKDRSEELLLNILPFEIAEELKANGFVVARDFDLVSILFTDFKSFTEVSEKLSPQSLVEEINTCFKQFDRIVEKYNLEKIKTIGDAYMAAGGLPDPDNNATKNIILAGLEMQAFIAERKKANSLINKPAFEMRLGIHAGPIVAGIVGIKKFQYDVWGDTVNTASRVESNGEIGEVNVSEVIYNLMYNDSDFTFKYRGLINAKGKGNMKMYFIHKK